jgi:hypothetical protein
MAGEKIIIYAPFALWNIHFATDLEIAQRCLDKGDYIYWISCHADLPLCRSNRKRYSGRCLSCQYIRKLGLEWLAHDSVQNLSLNNINKMQQHEIHALLSDLPQTLDELKKLELGGTDIGLAVLSSLVSHLREPSPDIQKHQRLVQKYLTTAAIVYFSLSNHIASIKPDKMYILNGRFAALRPALRVAQKMQVPIFTHERAGIQGRFILTYNNFPHDINHVKQSIETHWLESKDAKDQKKRISDAWYQDRMKGKDQAWVNFTRKQKSGEIPIEFDSSKTNFGIFISSEDEFVAFSEWNNPLYIDQNDGVAQILKTFKEDDTLHFYIRVHPNLARLANTQTKKLQAIVSQYSNVTLIDPESEVDTYALVNVVDAVLTFGTTVGIEAVHLGRPSILLGRAFYEDTGVTIRPGSHKEVISILKNFKNDRKLADPDLLAEGAQKFGYYLATFGEPYFHVRQTSVSDFKMIRNDRLQPIKLDKKKEIYHIFAAPFMKKRNKLF